MYQAKSHTFGTDSSQPDSPFPNKSQRLVDIGDLMHPHLPPPFSGWHFLPGDELQQAEEVSAITKVVVKLVYLDTHLTEVRVAPGCEGLNQEGKKDPVTTNRATRMSVGGGGQQCCAIRAPPHLITLALASKK